MPCWCFLDCRTHTQWGFVYGRLCSCRRTVLDAVSRTNGETCFVPVEAMWSNAEAHNGNDEPQALKNLETADDLFARFCLGTGTRFTWKSRNFVFFTAAALLADARVVPSAFVDWLEDESSAEPNGITVPPLPVPRLRNDSGLWCAVLLE